MKVELLDAGAPAWAAILAEAEHDFYARPGYVALEAARLGGAPAAFRITDDGRTALVPLVLRPTPDGRRDGISPYGYPGVVLAGTDDRGFTAEALGSALPTLREAGIVSVLLRLNPLLDVPPPDRPGRIIHHGDTVPIDLTATEDELWSRLRRDHRSQIRRSLRLGHRAIVDPPPDRFGDFVRIYLGTMTRVEADAAYRFDAAYFEGLRASLGDDLHLIIVDIEGAVAAAALFVRTGGIVEYHLAGTDDAYLPERPSKLLLHAATLWAKADGARVLHLGGGVGAADDSLLHFKAGFSPLRAAFHTQRIVVDASAYGRLVRAADPTVDPTDLGGFFPAYRRSPSSDPVRSGTDPTSGESAR